jgi:glycosyltransferase involved in cell wall biosynthesis
MKVLIINTNENKGGAAISSKRLYESLSDFKLEVKYLVDIKNTNNFKTISPNKITDKIFRILRYQLDQMLVKLYWNRSNHLFSPNNTYFTNNILKKIKSINPDIIHLHWINNGMLNIKDLLKLNKPIVWTMHDSWLFTGGCHLPYNCQKFKNECNSCEALGSTKKKDLSNKIFRIKKDVFKKLKINVITPSNWLASNAKMSELLKGHSINVIPNPIDTDLYSPTSKKIARDLLFLPSDKTIVLFGASSATSDANKGFKQLNDAINKLKLNNLLLIVMGGYEPEKSPNFKYPVKYLGELNDDITIKLVYNSADVSIVPSLSENLSNTIMESLSCGVPTVAFDIGGNSDLIDHLQNGYLAIPFNVDDLAKGIEWILNTGYYLDLCQNARKKVLDNFDSKRIALRHIDFYTKILSLE